MLLHSCLETFWTSVVSTSDTFERKSWVMHKFARHLNENCRYSAKEHLYLKYFLKIAFVREILPKNSLGEGVGCYRHEWVIFLR